MISPGQPPSNVIECRDSHLYYLCERMRPDEIEQFVALVGLERYDWQLAARNFASKPGMKFTLLDNAGLPAAAGGYEEVAPGVWQSWMVGTPEGWAEQWRSMTKAVRWLMAGMFEMGARRLQTNCIASRTKAMEWYERGLGLQLEGTWRKFASNGDDVACYAKIRED